MNPRGGAFPEFDQRAQEWIRNFVRAARVDQEDLVESDSDEDAEEEEVIFWEGR